MTQFTEQQLKGIVSPDKERLIYEIKNSLGMRLVVSEWPNTNISILANGKEYFTYNSIGKWIATFKLKSWK